MEDKNLHFLDSGLLILLLSYHLAGRMSVQQKDFEINRLDLDNKLLCSVVVGRSSEYTKPTLLLASKKSQL